MHDALTASPRWGNQARDHKALAIWHTLLLHCGPGIADGAWLDVGCGSGGIAMTLATKVRHISGVDPDPWKAWSIAMATHPNLALVVGTFDSEISPIPESSIDIAICNQVYEHVGDPRALLRNIYRVLVPGGTCYFAGPNLLWPIEPHVFWPFVHWLPRARAQALMRVLGSSRVDDLDAYSTHYWRLRNWFRSHGFEVQLGLCSRLVAELQVRGHNRAAALVLRLPRVISRLGMPLSPGFIFVLRKPD